MAAVEDHASAPWHRMAILNLGDVRGKRVLEIGCGRGGFSGYLAAQGAQLTAADFSDEAVAIARRALSSEPNVDVMVADIENIPFPDETFDIVVSLETLEHVPSPQRGLRELVRVAKKGGRILTSTPNYISIDGLYRIYLWARGRVFTELGQPINHPLSLIGRYRQLKKLGCRIVKVDGVGFYLPVPGRRPVEFLLPIPRTLSKWFALHSFIAAERRSDS